MTRVALWLSVVFSVGSLVWGYAHAGWESAARWILAFGFAWLIALWRRWQWFSSLALLTFVFCAAFGLVVGLGFGWMLTSSLFALYAWDLTDFRRRLHLAPADEDSRGLERRRLARLSLLALASLALVSLALYAQAQFTFEWGVFLVIVIVFGLTQLAGWFRRQKQ